MYHHTQPAAAPSTNAIATTMIFRDRFHGIGRNATTASQARWFDRFCTIDYYLLFDDRTKGGQT